MLNEVFGALRSSHIQDQTKHGDDEKCHQDGEKFHGITVVKCHRPLAKAATRPQGLCLFALSFVTDWINIHYENWMWKNTSYILRNIAQIYSLRAFEPEYLSSQLKQYYHNWFETKRQDIAVGVSFMLNHFNNMNQISVQFRFEMSMDQHQSAFHQR